MELAVATNFKTGYGKSVSDLAYGIRMLRKAPAFTATAVLIIALGAHGASIVLLVVGQATRLAMSGIGIGLASTFALTRVMESLLYKVSPTDPVVSS